MNDAISNMGDIVNKVYDDKMSEVVRDAGKELAELRQKVKEAREENIRLKATIKAQQDIIQLIDRLQNAREECRKKAQSGGKTEP